MSTRSNAMQVETLLVVHHRRRFLLHAVVLTAIYGLLGLLAWRFGVGSDRLAAGVFTDGGPDTLSGHPPLLLIGHLIARHPVVLAAIVGGTTIGYLSYYATTYAGSVPLRVLLVIYIVLSPSMITLVLFNVDWFLLVALVVASYGFLLEYCRRGRGVDIFLCGLALGAAYLVVPESATYAVPFAVAVAATAASGHSRRIYLVVLLFPVISAAFGWALLDWHLTGSISAPVPRMAAGVDTEGLLGLALSSGPFVLLYIIMCVTAAFYSKVMRGVVIVLLVAPVGLIALSVVWETPIPAFVHVPLLVSGVVILYPYLDTVVPQRILGSVLVLLLVTALVRDSYTVFYQANESVRRETETVREYGDRGSVAEETPRSALVLDGEE